ncbi:MAG: ABC transporter permease [Candidatus Omnitrophica bacterium]|nr:ABC transporter permease [Candidatus Omnitrophota bacterium]
MKGRFFENLGNQFVAFLAYWGGLAALFTRTLYWIVRRNLDRRAFTDQMWKVGVTSLPIVFLTALFTGMVLALQSAYQMQKIAAEVYIASLVALSITRELGPVLTALVVAGRVGAAITAEIGSMTVTEQVDALRTLGTDPVKYLVVPRFMALLVMLPLLTVYADMIGLIGGYTVGVFKLGIGSPLYIRMTFDPLAMKDLLSGLFKSGVFSMIICIVACFEGFRTEGGAEGVGKSTTMAVVISFVLIISADCLFTALFYFVL